jgi:hypothetical protein
MRAFAEAYPYFKLPIEEQNKTNTILQAPLAQLSWQVAENKTLKMLNKLMNIVKFLYYY